jgi:phosphate ABC transporter phosphate-binding protein
MVENVFAPDFASANSGDSVTYGSVGSGAGIMQIEASTVDFGASDAPLTSSQAGACSSCVEIPWALSSTGLSYNLTGVNTLKLSGPVIAEIYLGQITNWDNPAIKALNPGETLPNETITPIYRSDGSGDTYVFTDFLSKVSSAWASKVGFATSVSFPVGTGAKGNSGVALAVASTPGSIGNNSGFYIRDNNLHEVAIENAAGQFEYQYVPNIVDAAKLLKTSNLPDLTTLSSSTAASIAAAFSLTDPAYHGPKLGCPKPKKGKKAKKCKKAKLTALQHVEAAAYPISTFTYAIVRPSDSQIALLKQFISFAITAAEQKKGANLTFAPLPAAVVAADTAAVGKL